MAEPRRSSNARRFFGFRTGTAFVLLFVFGFPGALAAEAGGSASRGSDTRFASEAEDESTLVDAFHRNVSRRLLSTAEWLDSFFHDARYEEEVNATRLRLSFESSLIDAEGLDTDVRTRLRIVLPELENRLSLEIAGDTRDEFRDTPSGSADFPDDDADEGELRAGIRYLIRGTERLNLDLSTGARIRDLRPVLYVEPRHRMTFDRDPWTLRFTQLVRWLTDDGWEPRSRFDLERTIFEDYFFRSTAEVKWFEREPGIFYDLDFSVSRALDPETAVEFQWNNRFQTRPHHQLAVTYVQLRYRRVVWRDWLSFEVGPQLAFPEDRDYRSSLGAFFNLHVVFGHVGR